MVPTIIRSILKSEARKLFATFCDGKFWPGSVWIRIGLAHWIRIRIDQKSWIRIRTETNTYPQHWEIILTVSIADPDPQNQYVFRPPGSGSFYHLANIVRKNWFLLFWDFFMTFIFEIMYMYLQKVLISKKTYKKNLVDVLKITDDNSRIRIRIKISWIRNTADGNALSTEFHLLYNPSFSLSVSPDLSRCWWRRGTCCSRPWPWCWAAPRPPGQARSSPAGSASTTAPAHTATKASTLVTKEIAVLRIRMFLGLPDPDPLVRGTVPCPINVLSGSK